MCDATSTDSAWYRRRWLVLGVIGLAQLMVVLDTTTSGFSNLSRHGGPHQGLIAKNLPASGQRVAVSYVPASLLRRHLRSSGWRSVLGHIQPREG